MQKVIVVTSSDKYFVLCHFLKTLYLVSISIISDVPTLGQVEEIYYDYNPSFFFNHNLVLFRAAVGAGAYPSI